MQFNRGEKKKKKNYLFINCSTTRTNHSLWILPTKEEREVRPQIRRRRRNGKKEEKSGLKEEDEEEEIVGTDYLLLNLPKGQS
jgi:hypothetical protein